MRIKNKTDRKDHIKKFCLFTFTTYGLMWGTVILILVIGATGILPISLQGDSPFLTFAKIFLSWTPTMALLLQFKKLFPGITPKQYFTNAFHYKLNFKIMFWVLLLQVALNILTGCFVAVDDGVAFSSLWHFSMKDILLSALINLVTGATGEESGWHGFLQPFLSKDIGLVPAGIVVGIVWGFWHLPLWLLSGYTGMDLFWYIAEFMICTIDWAIVMGIFYDWGKNLIIPMWTHFLINFLMTFFVGNDLKYQISLCVLYSITAIVLSIVYCNVKKRMNKVAV